MDLEIYVSDRYLLEVTATTDGWYAEAFYVNGFRALRGWFPRHPLNYDFKPVVDGFEEAKAFADAVQADIESL